MPHEEKNARTFEKDGFGKVINVDDLKMNISDMLSLDYDVRLSMSDRGKQIVDGNEVNSIIDIMIGER